MNAILAFSQLLVRSPDISEGQRRQLTTILRSGEHLLDLINEILKMSRIESGKVTPNVADFDLHTMLDDVERTFSVRAEAKKISFRVERESELPHRVEADEAKLRQVLVNLLGNALKFTPTGGRVVLRMRSQAESRSGVRLYAEIEDTGVGIAPEDMSHLFQPFLRAEEGRQSSGGTGLGLTISRHFARIMGGDISVSSELGKGSTFRFDAQIVPIVGIRPRIDCKPQRRRVRLCEGTPPCRILIVDDAAENRGVIEDFLGMVGFLTRSAVDGEDAITQCAAWNPHLVLMDVQMPGIDGHEATERIRAVRGPAVKIVAVSANVYPQDRQRALLHGADAFLGKPFRLTELLEQIRLLTGVNYVEEVSSATSVPPPTFSASPSVGSLEAVPAGLVSDLANAARRADYDQMLVVLNCIATHDSGVAGQLRAMVEQFDFARLLQLVDRPADPKPRQSH